MAELIYSSLFMLALGWVAFGLAEHKGLNPYTWMALTILLLVPLFILFVLPSRTPNESSSTQPK